jgi:hypothetical protein
VDLVEMVVLRAENDCAVTATGAPRRRGALHARSHVGRA